jgi:RNase P subunit RPR2
MSIGWRLLERIYKFVFCYRPVFCSHCDTIILVKNAPRRSPDGLQMPRWRFYCRKCADFF